MPALSKKLCVLGIVAFAGTVAISVLRVSADDENVPPPQSEVSHPNKTADSRESYLRFAGQRAGQERDDNGLKIRLVWCLPGKFTMETLEEVVRPAAVESEPEQIDDDRIPYDDEVIDQVVIRPSGPKVRGIAIRREEHVNKVYILRRGYWLGKYEVTQSEWKRVTGSEPWHNKLEKSIGDDFPAVFVSWDDAVQFCHKLTQQERIAGRLAKGWEYTLPSEGQWESACRARSASLFGFEDETRNIGDFAWCVANSGDVAHPVGQKEANRWGLHDMHGNVWEWCRDVYFDAPLEVVDPEAKSGGASRVFRGCAWHSVIKNSRSLTRGGIGRDYSSKDLGFRIALCPVR